MSKITVKDLQNLEKELPTTKTFQIGGLSINVKQYLPIIDKIKLISSIYKSAIDEEDELQIIDYNSLDIAYKVLVVKSYASVNLPKNTVQSYNLLVSTGLYEKIYETIPESEITELENVLDNFITEKQVQYERENAVPYVVKKLLKELVGKVPSLEEAQKFITDAGKQIGEFDPSKMKYLNEFTKMNKGEDIG